MENLLSINYCSGSKKKRFKRSKGVGNKYNNNTRTLKKVEALPLNGAMMMQCRFTEGYFVTLRTSHSAHPLALESFAAKQKLVLSFTLSSSVGYHIGNDQRVQQKSAQFNVVFMSCEENLYSLSHGPDEKTLEIGFDLSYLQMISGTFQHPLKPLLDKVNNAKSFFYFKKSRYISLEMDCLLSRLQKLLSHETPSGFMIDYLVTNLLLQALNVGNDPLYEHLPYKYILEKKKSVLEVIDLACSDLQTYYSFDYYAEKATMSATTLKKSMRKFTGFTLKDH